MRSDAARNTARVVEEARRAVAAGETDLSLNALARRAGVGVGTVYRVFPTQRAMVEAVVEDAVTDLTRTATEAARDHDALRGRERFLRTAFDVALTRPGLFNALISLDNDRESLARAKGALMAAVSELLRRGDKPPVLTGENLLKLLCGVVHAVGEHAADRRQAAADVYFTVLLRGLEHATAAEDLSSGEYAPSPTAWVRDAVERFEASNGEANLNEPGGGPIIVITTVGARTGKTRKSPIMRIEKDGNYLAVASNSGARENPGWVVNVRARPTVELQDGPVRKPYIARELDGEERREWWDYAIAVWPTYREWQKKTDRQIPLFLLEPLA